MHPDLSPYYKLLGLPENATSTEVKRQYRKLVLKYHPDRNNGNDAAFIKIKEAYEIITGKQKAPVTSTPQSASKSTSVRNTQPMEERVAQARRRHQEQVYNDFVETENYYQRLTSGVGWKIIRFNAFLGAFLAIVLFFEPLLPHHYTPNRVVKYSTQEHGGLNRNSVSLIQLEDGRTFFVEELRARLYTQYPEVFVQSTWLFHNPVALLSIEGAKTHPYRIHFSFGAHNILFGSLFLLPLFTYIYRRRTIVFTIAYQISLYGVTAVIGYFVLSNDRWLHVLTLGFF